MDIEIIRGNDLPLSTWSGGISRQYWIFPRNSSYQEKNFLFRLSTASSTKEEETGYTSLPGITRHLIILEGSIIISHEKKDPKIMTPYQEIDIFDGGWKTSAKGICRDFNLMIHQSGTGNLQVLKGNQKIYLNSLNSKSHQWLAFLAAEQEIQLILPLEQKIRLFPGDLLLVKNHEKTEMIEIINPKGHVLQIEASLPK